MKDAAPSLRTRHLYEAAAISKEMPAYVIRDVLEMPGSELRDLRAALELLKTAREARE